MLKAIIYEEGDVKQTHKLPDPEERQPGGGGALGGRRNWQHWASSV